MFHVLQEIVLSRRPLRLYDLYELVGVFANGRMKGTNVRRSEGMKHHLAYFLVVIACRTILSTTSTIRGGWLTFEGSHSIIASLDPSENNSNALSLAIVIALRHHNLSRSHSIVDNHYEAVRVGRLTLIKTTYVWLSP